MSIPRMLQECLGSWTGRNQLWLAPDETAQESVSTVTVSPAAGDKFVALEYTWAYGDEVQAGLLLLGAETEKSDIELSEEKRNVVNAVWVDSWHMGDSMMHCQGEIEQDGLIRLVGAYAFGDGPEWGWRITLQVTEHGRLKIVMFNISPEGQEDLAVMIDSVRQN